MSESKYVIFNCSRGPITLTLYKHSDLEELNKYASYKRRKEARKVFKTVVIQSNSSVDLVAATQLPICEFENNKELQKLIRASNKLRVVVNTDHPEQVSIPAVMPVIKAEIPQEIPQEIALEEPVSVPEVVVSDIIEEVVDPEELKKVIIAESDIVDRGEDIEEPTKEPVEEVAKESKKRGPKSKRNRK